MKNKNYLVSVILPNYNCSKFLSRSINSVLNQTYKYLELIIVDDCSTDNSVEIIRQFLKKDKRIKFLRRNKNSGTDAAPRNLGISKSRGKFIAFLDADDHWKEDKLTYQINNIKNFHFSFTAADYNTEGSLKNSNFLITYLRVMLQNIFIYLIKNQGYYWLYVYNPFLISSVIINKKIFKNFMFDENPHKIVDLSFWLQVFKKNNKKFIFIPRVFLTISRTVGSMSYHKIEILNKVINNICSDFLETKNFKKFNLFLIGIILRVLKILISKIYINFRKSIIRLLILVSILYFTFFYTPLMWNIGNNLLYFDESKKTDAVFVLSGHQGFKYWNDTYLERYIDAREYNKRFNTKNDIKYILLGKLKAIPEQKIIESLLINLNIDSKNIHLIYQEYLSSEHGLKLLKKEMDSFNIKNITIITSPYHTLRLKYLWDQVFDKSYNSYFFKNLNLPKKNNYFERSLNKKEIIFEILANLNERYIK